MSKGTDLLTQAKPIELGTDKQKRFCQIRVSS
jgi:hypothetical protein